MNTTKQPPKASLDSQIRSRIAQIASHPSSIAAQTQNGVVTLSGPILDHEAESLLHEIRGLQGVKEVRDRLDVLSSPRDFTKGTPSQDQFGYRPQFIVGRWAPWIRITLGSTGLLLMAQGIWKKGRFRSASSLIGAGLLSRSLTNQDLTQLFGALILPVLRMRRSLRIDAPVDDVFDFWKRFENYSKFMSFIQSVEVNDTGGLRWVAEAPGKTRIHWDAALVSLLPNQKIAWKSVPGSLIATEGAIEMKPLSSRSTQLNVELSYAPPFGALGYAAAHFLGFDPRSRIDEDLEVMRLLIEKPALKYRRETA